MKPPFPWLEDVPDTFKHHLEHPDVDAASYTRQKRLRLGERAVSLRRVYLDTKYWVYLRDSRLQRPQKDIHVQINAELERLRANDSTICPISYPVYSELLYQSDRATRQATAEVIDKLSGGYSIQPPRETFNRELAHFYARATNPSGDFYRLIEMVWTKVAFVLGDRFLELNDEFPAAEAVAMEKAMDDLLWSVNLVDIIEKLPLPDGIEQQRIVRLASTLTDGKIQHQRSCDTFDSLFLDEVTGIMDGLNDVLSDFMLHQARQYGVIEYVPAEDRQEAGRMLGNLIRAAFQHKRLTYEMPSVSIPAALHALVRLDKGRKYKKGDFEDFNHAAAAIGFCDLFLTESSLCHLVNTREFDCKRTYGCRVLSHDSSILNHLKTLE